MSELKTRNDFIEEVIDGIIAELHKEFGICSHCGKVKCSGKESMSRLPLHIETTGLLSLFKKVQNELEE